MIIPRTRLKKLISQYSNNNIRYGANLIVYPYMYSTYFFSDINRSMNESIEHGIGIYIEWDEEREGENTAVVL